jgi:hypothetical protein
MTVYCLKTWKHKISARVMPSSSRSPSLASQHNHSRSFPNPPWHYILSLSIKTSYRTHCTLKSRQRDYTTSNSQIIVDYTSLTTKNNSMTTLSNTYIATPSTKPELSPSIPSYTNLTSTMSSNHPKSKIFTFHEMENTTYQAYTPTSPSFDYSTENHLRKYHANQGAENIFDTTRYPGRKIYQLLDEDEAYFPHRCPDFS